MTRPEGVFDRPADARQPVIGGVQASVRETIGEIGQIVAALKADQQLQIEFGATGSGVTVLRIGYLRRPRLRSLMAFLLSRSRTLR